MAVVLTSSQNEISKRTGLETLCKNTTPTETQAGRGKAKTTSDGSKRSRSQVKKQTATSRTQQNDSATQSKDSDRQLEAPKALKQGPLEKAKAHEINRAQDIQNGDDVDSAEQSAGVDPAPPLELHPIKAVPISHRNCHSETDLPSLVTHSDGILSAQGTYNPSQESLYNGKDMRICLLEVSELPENHLLMYPAGCRNDSGTFDAWYPTLNFASTFSHLRSQKLTEKSRSLPVSQRDSVYERLQTLGRHRNFEFSHYPDETGRYIEEYRAMHTVGRVGKKNKPAPVLGIDVPDPYASLNKKGSTTTIVESWQHRLQEEKQLQQQRQQQQPTQEQKQEKQLQQQQQSSSSVPSSSTKPTESRNFPILAAIRERSNNLQVKGHGAKGRSDKGQNAEPKTREIQQTVFLPPIENTELRVSLVGSKNNNNIGSNNSTRSNNNNVSSGKSNVGSEKDLDYEVGQAQSDSENNIQATAEPTDINDSNSNIVDNEEVLDKIKDKDDIDRDNSLRSKQSLSKEEVESQERMWRNYVVDAQHESNKLNFSEDYRTALLSYRSSATTSLGSNRDSTKGKNSFGSDNVRLTEANSATSSKCIAPGQSSSDATVTTEGAVCTNKGDSITPTNENSTRQNPKQKHLLSKDKDYSRLFIEITNPPKSCDNENAEKTLVETESECSETTGISAKTQEGGVRCSEPDIHYDQSLQHLKSHKKTISPNCDYHLDRNHRYKKGQSIFGKSKKQNSEDYSQMLPWRVDGEYFQYRKVESKVKTKRLNSKDKENHSVGSRNSIDTSLELRGVECRTGVSNDDPGSGSSMSLEKDGQRARSVNSDDQTADNKVPEIIHPNNETFIDDVENNHKQSHECPPGRSSKLKKKSKSPLKNETKPGNDWPVGFQRRKILRHSFNGHGTGKGGSFNETPTDASGELQNGIYSLHQSYPLLDWKKMVDNGDCGFIVRSFPSEKCESQALDKDKDNIRDDLEDNSLFHSETKEEASISGNDDEPLELLPGVNISKCLPKNVELEVQSCLTIQSSLKLKDHDIPYPMFPVVDTDKPKSETDEDVDPYVENDNGVADNVNGSSIPQVTLKMEQLQPKDVKLKGKLLFNNDSVFKTNGAFKLKSVKRLEPPALKIRRPTSLDRSVFESTTTSINLIDEIAKQLHPRRPTSLDRSLLGAGSSSSPDNSQHVICPDVYGLERDSNKKRSRSDSPTICASKHFMDEVKVKRELQIYAHVRKGTCYERQAEVIQQRVEKSKIKNKK